MKIIIVLIMLLLAAKAEPVKQAPVVYWEPSPVVSQAEEPDKEYRSGYEVVDKIDDTDVCLLIDGVPTWVTLIDEDGCDCETEVDWEEFDRVIEEIDSMEVPLLEDVR